jgi:hypothetical protein
MSQFDTSVKNSYLCTKGVTTMIAPGERLIQLEGFSPRDGYCSMVVHTRFYFSLYVFLKKGHLCNYELMRALWIHCARLFLLRPLILITPCIMPRLLWTCLRISYSRSYHAITLKWKIKLLKVFFKNATPSHSLTPIQTARTIAKLEKIGRWLLWRENLHCTKTCIVNIVTVRIGSIN